MTSETPFWPDRFDASKGCAPRPASMQCIAGLLRKPPKDIGLVSAMWRSVPSPRDEHTNGMCRLGSASYCWCLRSAQTANLGALHIDLLLAGIAHDENKTRNRAMSPTTSSFKISERAWVTHQSQRTEREGYGKGERLLHSNNVPGRRLLSTDRS